MTRDEVLEEAAEAVMRAVCGCAFAPCPHDEQRQSSAAWVRALKSNPWVAPLNQRAGEALPGEVSIIRPTVDPWAMSPEELLAALLAARTEMADAQVKTAEATTRAEEAEAERDRHRLAATTATEEWKAWQTRAAAAEAKLAKLEKSAAETTARVEALTAEVKHREWVDNGSPMKGEAP